MQVRAAHDHLLCWHTAKGGCLSVTSDSRLQCHFPNWAHWALSSWSGWCSLGPMQRGEFAEVSRQAPTSLKTSSLEAPIKIFNMAQTSRPPKPGLAYFFRLL